MATQEQIDQAVAQFQNELDQLSARCWVYDISTKTTCGKPATRYMRIGDVIEHICESCYQRDIVYPGAHPATEREYNMYRDSDDD